MSLLVLQRTAFYRSGVFHYQNIQYFIMSKCCALNFTAVTYSLHKCSETVLC